MKKSCPVNSVTDCFFHKSCLLSFTDYKTRRDTPYNRLYEDTPPGRKGCFFHPRVMSKVSNLESEAYRKRAKEKRIFYTECFLHLVLFLLDKKTTITIPPFLAGNSPFWPWAWDKVGVLSKCTTRVFWRNCRFFYWLLRGYFRNWIKLRPTKQSHGAIRQKSHAVLSACSNLIRLFTVPRSPIFP